MTIVYVDSGIKEELKKSNFSSGHLNNCINSKFLSIEQINSQIVGACFVGGIMNFNGIEIQKEFRGKGLGKKLLSEILAECKKENISFLSGVFKPSNITSIKAHTKIGYKPVFTCHYSKKEGKEIVVILPFNKKGLFMINFMKIFNTRIGNAMFALLLYLLKPFLKNLIAFSANAMPEIELSYSLSNFEKVQDTFKEIDSIINKDTKTQQ